MAIRTLLLTAIFCGTFGSVGAADLTELRVFPAEVSLTTNADRQSMVVQAVYADGLTRDVTGLSQWSFAQNDLVRQEGAVLYPARDGVTELTVSYEGQSVVVPVKVEKSAEGRTISFKLDVMPVFMKAGCNTGSCHGARVARMGFACRCLASTRMAIISGSRVSSWDAASIWRCPLRA
ncbi:MAG: hypothetical protein R3B90_17485 [Planctomycetaceae bacterium]